MQELQFETLLFEDVGDELKVLLLKVYEARIARGDLEKIGKYHVQQNKISFEVESPKTVGRFYALLAQAFGDLQNRISRKRTVYINKGSGLPLVGNIAFGITDRGTNIIEVKPMTGCNIKCTYCSVNEDARVLDFVVEKDYLVEECAKIIQFKECDDVEIHIGPQGEPLLYADLVELVRDLRKIPQVKRISMVTNGTLFTTRSMDALIAAGLTRVDLSINALNPKTAQAIANVGAAYTIEKIKGIAQYLSDKVELVITPTWLQGVNDEDIDALVAFTKGLANVKFHPKMGIQNFLEYKYGRNPVEQASWETFYAFLKVLEKKHDAHLIIDENDFHVKKTKFLPKPFRKREVIDVEVVCQGRLSGEWIGVAKERAISVYNCAGIGLHQAKVTRSKHNIFTAVCL